MVQGRPALTRRSLALILLVATVLDGCATYPSAVATKGQDMTTTERDARECRDRAEDEVKHPLAVGLGTKLLWALGGAVLGTGMMLGITLPNENGQVSDGKVIGLAIGGGAALGFTVGSIVGTFKGADEGSRAARGREQVFARCMTERGYRFE